MCAPTLLFPQQQPAFLGTHRNEIIPQPAVIVIPQAVGLLLGLIYDRYFPRSSMI